jgi:hypothetical protein
VGRRILTKSQRVQKQLSNAQEKLERAQRHAEDRKVASQKTIDRLQREYDEMAIERRDNDKQVEEIRGEANELEKKVTSPLLSSVGVLIILGKDGRAPEAQRNGIKRTVSGVLEAPARYGYVSYIYRELCLTRR